jgi:hypothetical protein
VAARSVPISFGLSFPPRPAPKREPPPTRRFQFRPRLEKLYAGRCFVGLRIPDADAGARLHIDVVLVTKRSVYRLVCNLLYSLLVLAVYLAYATETVLF